jgi:threonyl-tRNA synthetase
VDCVTLWMDSSDSHSLELFVASHDHFYNICCSFCSQVHRAMLGSVERMTAVLTEHWGGKWPFWISPRQLLVVPVDLKYVDYTYEVGLRYRP